KCCHDAHREEIRDEYLRRYRRSRGVSQARACRPGVAHRRADGTAARAFRLRAEDASRGDEAYHRIVRRKIDVSNASCCITENYQNVDYFAKLTSSPRKRGSILRPSRANGF